MRNNRWQRRLAMAQRVVDAMLAGRRVWLFAARSRGVRIIG